MKMESLLYDVIGEGYEETPKRYLVFAVNSFLTFGVFYACLEIPRWGVEGGSIQKSMEKETPFFGS